jgi:anti-anti-sigma factor
MMLPEEQSIPDIRERIVGGVIVLSPEGGLKGNIENHLKERIDAHVRDGRLEILIDMKHMPRIDSSELGRLIRSHISVRQAGGRVRLCNISDRVMMLMKMSKLDTVLDLYPTEEEALAGIREHRGDSLK